MRILVCYATTEGQTRKICRFVADHLMDGGHSVELLAADDGLAEACGVDLNRFDAAVLAGSVHVGRVQRALIEFASDLAEGFRQIPVLYLQVSLAAAGKDAEELAELERITEETVAQFGWTPAKVLQVAGAFRFSEYDFFKAWAMRWIASQHGQAVVPGEDREYTDWRALAAAVDAWAEAAAMSR